MNWRRGLFRAWVVISSLWIAIVLLAFRSAPLDYEDVWLTIATALGPPTLLVALGRCIWWIATGFRPSEKGRDRHTRNFPAPETSEYATRRQVWFFRVVIWGFSLAGWGIVVLAIWGLFLASWTIVALAIVLLGLGFVAWGIVMPMTRRII